MDALPAAGDQQGPPQPDESWDHHYRDERDAAYLYRRLATLRTDVPLTETLDDLRWQGASMRALKDLCRELGNDDIIGRVPLWRDE